MVEDSFEDKLEYLRQNVCTDPFMDGADLMKLISLLCLITQANRKKNPDFSVTDAMNIAIKDEPENKIYEYLKVRIPIMCELFLQGPETSFNSYGLKGKESIVAEIKKILDDWIPF